MLPTSEGNRCQCADYAVSQFVTVGRETEDVAIVDERKTTANGPI